MVIKRKKAEKKVSVDFCGVKIKLTPSYIAELWKQDARRNAIEIPKPRKVVKKKK